MDLLPTLLEAANGPTDLKEQAVTSYKGHKGHLGGCNQMNLQRSNLLRANRLQGLDRIENMPICFSRGAFKTSRYRHCSFPSPRGASR